MLSDLAARMTAQVAQEEGPGSQVDKALEALMSIDLDESAAQDSETLADRIRTHREPVQSQ